MSACLKWILLFISCITGHVTGQLHKPLNVNIESRNFSLFLTWLPAPENPSTVTYEVQYTNFTDDHDAIDPFRWTQVPACGNISITECDFTCVLMECWDWTHIVRVRTVYPSTSPWVEIKNIQYMFTVDPDPPNLTVTQGDGSITIHTCIKKPFCVRESILQRSLKYSVTIRKKRSQKEVLEQEVDGTSITMKTLGYNGEYCVAAKTIYTTNTKKDSNFSHPVCLNFTQTDGNFLKVLSTALSIPVICGVAVIIFFLIWYWITIKSQKPQALDFSKNKHCQNDRCVTESYSENFHSLTIYNIAEQDSSTKLLPPNKYDDDVNIYPNKGYLERRTIQPSDSNSQEYFSSKRLAFNCSSDQSSSGCTCPNTSGSATDQTNDCSKQININVSDDTQMFSTTSVSRSNLFDSLSILETNSFVNVPLDTLCIKGKNDLIDSSDEESGIPCFTDSKDDLDSLSIDFTDNEMSDSIYPSEDEITHKDRSSGYTQRTYMSRRC